MLDTLNAWLGAPAFMLAAYAASRAELIAALLGVWMVVCNIRVKPLAWPLAITSSALYGLVFHGAGLHGNAWLQALFIVVALWGWWLWLHGAQADGAALRVGPLGSRARLLVLLAWLTLWPVLLLALNEKLDLVATADAFTASGSVIGQLLLARKRLENWWIWIAVNSVGIVLFASQQLWLTVALYGLFLVMAIIGARAWHRLAVAR
jgi:nicotinamide mononucleotide transporter